MSASLVLTQTRFDLRLVMRNGEQLLLTVLIPLALLLALSLSSFVSLVVPDGTTRVSTALSGVLT
ncbi:MAG: ABC transporter permease, partial [Actinomycetota bacterium]